MVERFTEDQLIAAASRHGCKVSPDQLKRWRRAELIPRPTQTHPEGRHGSEATYPPKTLRQLLAVCRLRGRFKKLDRIRFELWWAGGYPGSLALVRKFLVSRFEKMLSELKEHRDRFDDPFEAAEAAVSGKSLESRDPALRAMRRFAKSDENLRSAAQAIFCDLFGAEVPWHFETKAGLSILIGLFGAEVISDVGALEPSLAELVEQVTGAQRAKSDVLDVGLPLLDATANVVEVIQRISIRRAFSLDDPGWAFKQASDDELERAREQAQLFVSGMGLLVQLTARRHGRDYAGLSILQGLIKPDPDLIVICLQLFLLLPTLLHTDDERANASNTLEALSQNLNQMRFVQEFLEEHPTYAFIFKPDGAGQLKALPTEERDLIQAATHDFIVRHPEYRPLLELEE